MDSISIRSLQSKASINPPQVIETQPEEPPVMQYGHIWIIPFGAFLCSMATALIPYGIASVNGHINTASIPFISDGGASPPENCVFGQLANIAAVLMGLSVYIRHRQIVCYSYEHVWQRWKRILSTVALWIGYLCALGASLVGNFGEVHCPVPHFAGAIITFWCGLFYSIIQTIFSYLMHQTYIAYLRTVITSMCAISLTIMIVCGTEFYSNDLAHIAKNGMSPYNVTKLDPLYDVYVCTTSCEWLMFITYIAFILTFAFDFWTGSVTPMQFKLQSPKNDNEQYL